MTSMSIVETWGSTALYAIPRILTMYTTITGARHAVAESRKIIFFNIAPQFQLNLRNTSTFDVCDQRNETPHVQGDHGTLQLLLTQFQHFKNQLC